MANEDIIRIFMNEEIKETPEMMGIMHNYMNEMSGSEKKVFDYIHQPYKKDALLDLHALKMLFPFRDDMQDHYGYRGFFIRIAWENGCTPFTNDELDKNTKNLQKLLNGQSDLSFNVLNQMTDGCDGYLTFYHRREYIVDNGDAIVMIPKKITFPIEIGYTNSSTTFTHLLDYSGVVRLPYDYDELCLLVYGRKVNKPIHDNKFKYYYDLAWQPVISERKELQDEQTTN